MNAPSEIAPCSRDPNTVEALAFLYQTWSVILLDTMSKSIAPTSVCKIPHVHCTNQNKNFFM